MLQQAPVMGRTDDAAPHAPHGIVAGMDYKTLERWLRKNRYTFETPRGGSTSHARLLSPEGVFLASWSGTPTRNGRGAKNAVAQLRRLGVPIPRKGQR